MGGVAHAIGHVFRGAAHAVSRVTRVITQVITRTIYVVRYVVTHTVHYITKVITRVVNVVSRHTALLIGLAAIFSVGVAPAIAAAFRAATLQASITSLAGGGILAQVGAGISTFVDVLKLKFSGVLAAIHFHTLYKIHSIAMLVSGHYREMMDRVYGEIQKASYALGFAPEFLGLAIRNSRAIVLDASAILGRKYDIAQIEWLKTFNHYLHEFNKNASRYERNPGAIFDDLDNMIDRPHIEAAGGFMHKVASTVDDVVKKAEKTVVRLVQLRDDLHRFAEDLPENIRSHVKPWINDLTREFDDFVVNIYEPNIGTLNNLIDALTGEQKSTRDHLDGLVRRLAYPGDYLSEVDYLPKYQKRIQENKIGEIASRSFGRQTEGYTKYNEAATETMAKILEVLRAVKKPPPWYIKELEVPQRPAAEPAKPGKTWFVGDY